MVPKIPSLPYRKVHRILRKAGFDIVRQKGGHIFYRNDRGRTTVVPRHAIDIDSDIVAKILKDAGIDPDEVRR